MLGGGDAAGETGYSGRRTLLREPQPGEVGGCVECAGAGILASPVHLHRIERPTRRKAREIVAPSRRHRQIWAELPQRTKLDTIERGVAVDRPASIVMHRQLEIGRVETGLARRGERELPCVDFAPQRIIVPADTALEPGQRKLWQIAGKLALDTAHDDVGDDVARLPIGDLQPHSEAPLPSRIGRFSGQPGPPCTDVGEIDPRVEASGRAVPVGQ